MSGYVQRAHNDGKNDLLFLTSVVANVLFSSMILAASLKNSKLRNVSGVSIFLITIIALMFH